MNVQGRRAARGSDEVDAFVEQATAWSDEIRKLRSILLGCGLQEALKWGKPCYLSEGRNIAIIQPFKAHCALMFFKGALLKDTHGLLRSQGKATQSAMRLEFTGTRQIDRRVVQDYVEQAIAVEQAGLKVEFAASRELELPEELARALQQDRALAKAFRALTPGRRRGFALHIAGAKQSSTRAARVQKAAPRILAGKGMHDPE